MELIISNQVPKNRLGRMAQMMMPVIKSDFDIGKSNDRVGWKTWSTTHKRRLQFGHEVELPPFAYPSHRKKRVRIQPKFCLFCKSVR